MGIETNSQNRWRTARERTRLKARYNIQTRIASKVVGNDNASIIEGTSCPSSLEHLNIALKYLQSIIKNDLSSFSVASLARDGGAVNAPLPSCCRTDAAVDLSCGIPKEGMQSVDEAVFALNMFLSTVCPWDGDNHSSSDNSDTNDDKPPRQLSHQQHQPATLATSKFSREFVSSRLMPYISHLQCNGGQLTLMEYASLLGRHGIVGLLLLGGIDPTARYRKCASDHGDAEGSCVAYQEASRRVLALLHSLDIDSQSNDKLPVIPLSLWSYIVRSVVEMRINGVLMRNEAQDCQEANDESNICRLCNVQYPASHTLLSFGPPCHHLYCEPCLWMHLVQHVPNYMDLMSNVVRCPVCHAEFGGFQCCEVLNDKHDGAASITDMNNSHLEIPHECNEANETSTREERRLHSLSKFLQLPQTSSQLKSMTRKSNNLRRRNIKDPIHSTWSSALFPMVANHLSQDVRSDRFFRAVISSPQLVLSYLLSGIDVNIQNSYGQTPLYVACWKGSNVIVELLLEYGADARIASNGGSTCISVARALGRVDVLSTLERFGVRSACRSVDSAYVSSEQDEDSESVDPKVTFLLDAAMDHPGAGACIVDNALMEGQLQQLEKLVTSLPIADCEESDYDTTTNTSNESSDNSKMQYRPTRSYYCDAERIIQDMLQHCVNAARKEVRAQLGSDEKELTPQHTNTRSPPISVFQHLRFLHYHQKGGLLPPHVDLCRIDDSSAQRSTHTFILYLTDCPSGGGTALLRHLNDPKVLAIARPKRGRALMFPHLCPHSGLEVESVPKIILRGEVII